MPEHGVRGVPIIAVIRKLAAERAEAQRVELMRPGGQAPGPGVPRLVEASLRYAGALREVAARDPEVQRLAVLLHAKVARIADDDESLWALDTVPNLLLIERTLAEIRVVAAPLPDPAAVYEAILRSYLAPLLARITADERAAISALAAAGRAPSPFSQRWAPVRRVAERS